MSDAYLAIVNPAAGGGRSRKLLGPALDRLKKAGVEVKVAETRRQGDATKIAREAFSRGQRRFIAVGGDGTSYEVVNGLFPEALTEEAMKNGQPLHEALEGSQLFDAEFLEMVVSGEEGGRVPEMMRHCAEQYQDETKRRMTMLTGAATALFSVVVAGFIIWAIFSLWSIYFGMLNTIR